MRRRLALVALASSATAGCVSVKLGSEPAAQVQLSLRDAAAAPPVLRVPLAVALTPALLIQAQPGQALADTLAIAYARREGEYAFYQLASWTEIPVRQVPRLLQRRLQQRHIADAVGLLGDPMGADWLLSVGVDSLHHDLRTAPGQGLVTLQVALFDRQARRRVAQARFAAAAPLKSADSAAAADALSAALALAFDELLPWLEAELARAVAAAGAPAQR